MLFFVLLTFLLLSYSKILVNKNKYEYIIFSSILSLSSSILIVHFLKLQNMLSVELSLVIVISIGVLHEIIHKVFGGSFDTLNIQAYILGGIIGVFQYALYLFFT
jgi:hypothetical protein